MASIFLSHSSRDKFFDSSRPAVDQKGTVC